MFTASTLISALQLVSFAKVARLMNPDIPPGKIKIVYDKSYRLKFETISINENVGK